MGDGALRLNGERFSKLYETIPDLKGGSAAFYEGEGSGKPEEIEALKSTLRGNVFDEGLLGTFCMRQGTCAAAEDD